MEGRVSHPPRDGNSEDEVNRPPTTNDPEIDARGRSKLRLHGRSFDDDPAAINSEIHNIIHGFYDGPWKTFTEVPAAVTAQWWSEFESKHYWEGSDGPQILKNWRKQCSKHISSTFCDSRDRNTKPKWISSENWAIMRRHWNEDEGFQQISETNKKNRASEGLDGVSNYAGGAKSTVAYKIEHKKKHGRDMTSEELLKKTYTKTNGEFSGDRVEKCLERLKELKKMWMETYGSISVEEEEKLHIIACGGEKKGSVFGFGSSYHKDERVLNPPALYPDQPLQPPPLPSRLASAARFPPLQPALPPLQPSSSSLAAQFAAPTSSLLMPAQAPPPPLPPPMPPTAGPSVTSSSIDNELTLWERFRRFQAYEEELQRTSNQMPQSSTPQMSFTSLMNSNSSMHPLMNFPPPAPQEFNPNPNSQP